jgi:hypothetical protein
MPVLPNPLKRGNLDDFSFSILFLRSLAITTSGRLIRRKPPESSAVVAAAVAAGAATSGLAGAPAGTSSKTLLCDFLLAVKSPRPGLPMARLSVCPLRGRRSQCPVWPTTSGRSLSCTRGAARQGGTVGSSRRMLDKNAMRPAASVRVDVDVDVNVNVNV